MAKSKKKKTAKRGKTLDVARNQDVVVKKRQMSEAAAAPQVKKPKAKAKKAKAKAKRKKSKKKK